MQGEESRRMMHKVVLSLFCLLLGLGACGKPEEPVLDGLPPVPGRAGAQAAGPLINGRIGSITGALPVQSSVGAPADFTMPGATGSAESGDISLDFADTDIREVSAQILGNILKVNYTVDPAVHGTATLRTVRPLTQAQLLPTLQALLAQNGAALIRTGTLYRVVPSATAGGSVSLGGTGLDATSGSTVVALRYASAEDLAKVLQPFVANGGKIFADPGRNALIIDGEPSTRETLTSLVRAFDSNILASQSYALFPVSAGGVKDFAAAMQDALLSHSGGALANVVRVVPMERVNAVLVISSQQRYVDEARRVYALVDRARGLTARSWHVIYLQNSHTNDVANVLQRAFTPNDVTVQPGPGQTAPGQSARQSLGSQSLRSQGGGGAFGNSLSSNGGGVGGGNGLSGLAGGESAASGGGQLAGRPIAAGSSGNPLLGGLDPTAGGEANPDAMRIIPNEQNNAILIYATRREKDTVDAMVGKIDILPLQVRIDAVIAEVTLNDQLQYGTQFFFKSGGVNGVLSGATQALGSASLASAAFNTALPGFVVGGTGLGGAPFVLSALQAVTTVQVLSSPELMVLDNQSARLQVGDVVPYLSQTSQSTVTSTAPVISSINYQQTGVIMEVTPRVNNGGLVTLDISQEVSDVAANVTTAGINSPTFQQRSVSSRIVVQDGQTIGLAGLIRDNVSSQNSGIPWLKDIPVLGLLAGRQANNRQRTELLVLITPHVVHDQRDARALTADLRDQLVNAAAVPSDLQNAGTTGSADPSARLRRRLRLQQ